MLAYVLHDILFMAFAKPIQTVMVTFKYHFVRPNAYFTSLISPKILCPGTVHAAGRNRCVIFLFVGADPPTILNYAPTMLKMHPQSVRATLFRLRGALFHIKDTLLRFRSALFCVRAPSSTSETPSSTSESPSSRQRRSCLY